MAGNLPDGVTQRDIDVHWGDEEPTPFDTLRHARQYVRRSCDGVITELDWYAFNAALDILYDAEEQCLLTNN